MVIVNQAIDQHYGQAVDDNPVEGDEPLLQFRVKVALVLFAELGVAQGPSRYRGLSRHQIAPLTKIAENRLRWSRANCR